MRVRALGRAAVGLALLALGCRAGAIPVAPPAAPEPPAIHVVPGLGEEPTRPHLEPPAGEEMVDELLASPVLRDAEFQAAVDEWVEYWGEAATGWMPDFLRRMGHFEQTVDSALLERGLPASLRYLPLIESGYNPGARSRAAAVGLWQFMPGTARELGMAITPLVDERRNPFRSTEAAMDFLGSLHDEFGSWFLALAAYNGGPNRARRILRTHAPLAEPSDSLFWALRRYFPRETRQFLPKLVGAITVATRPEAFGYPEAGGARFAFDAVSVPDATTLDVVAAAAETSEDEIRRLNPELVRGITPPGERFTLRVPEGRGALFTENYARIPADRRVTFVEHTVASGETLSHIALQYRVSIADLQAANPNIRPRYLRVGARLTVPVVTGARSAGS